jgi:pantoate kinase
LDARTDKPIRIPSHITGFFVPKWSRDPLETGSIGAGLVLEPGIEFEVNRAGRRGLSLNGNELRSEVLHELLPDTARVEVRSELPIGAGYAMSASLALACSIAAELQKAEPDLLSAFRRAHVAEVRAMTGLGDVLALHAGRGLAVRLKPGAPGIGEVEAIEVPQGISVVTAVLGSMSTTEMLTRYADRIRQHGAEAFRRFLRDPTLESFLENAREFAKGVGFLTQDVEDRMRPVREMLLGYSVKKRVLFAVVREEELHAVHSHLRTVFGEVHVHRVCDGKWSRYLEAIHAIAR